MASVCAAILCREGGAQGAAILCREGGAQGIAGSTAAAFPAQVPQTLDFTRSGATGLPCFSTVTLHFSGILDIFAKSMESGHVYVPTRPWALWGK